ncbi:MAG: hypothetical protein ACI92S_004463, partial [Planctomycetaceae bacterium]
MKQLPWGRFSTCQITFKQAGYKAAPRFFHKLSATMPLKIDDRDEERDVMLRTRDMTSSNPSGLSCGGASTVTNTVRQPLRGHYVVRCLTAVLLLSTTTGCTNTHLLSWSPFSWNSRETHRFNADVESYSIIEEKKSGTP